MNQTNGEVEKPKKESSFLEKLTGWMIAYLCLAFILGVLVAINVFVWRYIFGG